MGIGTGAYVAERDDWPSAVNRAVDEGWPFVELTAITETLFHSLRRYLSSPDARLSAFTRVSLHAPVVLDSPIATVAEAVVAADLPYDVVLHPDLYGSDAAPARLDGRAVFENMDVNKHFGRTTDDLAEVFDRFPASGFCLDVAHVWTNDATLRLGFELLDAHGDRLRQLHVSGIEPDGTHRPTTEVDLARYEPLLARCLHVPWVLESELVPSSHPDG